jgi:hypothetical protein
MLSNFSSSEIASFDLDKNFLLRFITSKKIQTVGEEG